jgi:dTMP kinase
MKGMYVVFEGIDGSGKTTLLRMAAEEIVAAGNVVYHIPGYVVPELKELIIPELQRAEPDQLYLSLLFAADRAKQTELIKDLMFKTDTVIMASRSYISGLVYQSIRSDLALTWLETVNKFCVEPDKIIYCDISVEEALKRVAIRRETDGFEEFEFLTAAKKSYETLLKQYDGKVLVINTEKPIEKNVKKIVEFLSL